LDSSKHLITLDQQFGPFRNASLTGNYCALVIVDDYSRYTWTFFIASKNDAFDEFKKLVKVIQNENNCSIKSIRSDQRGRVPK